MRHAVIMAGGSGTRLWPLSRRNRPKQLLRLFPGGSLLQIARRRLAPVFPADRIWVITSAAYIDQVAAELPDLERSRLIGEPTGRDTANAIGLAANLVALDDPDATMAVFTADHLIEPVDVFAEAVENGLAVAEADPTRLVTFGITPDRPHTGYGYVRRGEPLAAGVCRVREFREKPDEATARAFLASGEYLWNSGMFAWRTGAILSELSRRLPDNARTLAALAADWRRPGREADRAAAFASLTKISIDFAVMEHAPNLAVVEMACRWIDVGSWTAVGATAAPDSDGNVSLASTALAAGASGNIIISEDDHLIALLGVEDLVVVHSRDATLVCRRQDVEKVKDLAELRRRKFGERFE